MEQKNKSSTLAVNSGNTQSYAAVIHAASQKIIQDI